MNVVIVDDQTSARTMLRHIIEDIAPELRGARLRRTRVGTGLVRDQPAGPAAARLPHAGHRRAGVRAPLPPPAAASRHPDHPGDGGRRRAGAPGRARSRRDRFPGQAGAPARTARALPQPAAAAPAVGERQAARAVAGAAAAVEHARGRGARARDAVAAGPRDRVPRYRHQRVPRAHGARRRADRRAAGHVRGRGAR